MLQADNPGSGVFGFFKDVGVRETIESIIVAIVLALMFRAYEAEAFIIPTGSMAPSLQGQHLDLECDNCELRYRTGVSLGGHANLIAEIENFEAQYQTVNRGRLPTDQEICQAFQITENNLRIVRTEPSIDSTYCPICMYRTQMRSTEPDHNYNSGDRILVNKFVYDFNTPERYDVIVFKNPNNGKQNYIKRLIGLPGDNLLIENGDIYVMHPIDGGGYTREITRKPASKLKHVLQVVDDTHHIGKDLGDVDWPSRWQAFDQQSSWAIQESDGNPNFFSEQTAGENWLRYRHFQPLKSDWPSIIGGVLPNRYDAAALPLGRLIGDQYAYNDGLYRSSVINGEAASGHVQNSGLHWVGDIGVDCELKIKSGQGKLLLDIVEGGAHFICEIDVATGGATFRCDDSNVETKVAFVDQSGESVAAPTAQTSIKGPGDYKLEFVNADDRLHLWVDGKLIEINGGDYTRTGIPVPTYSPEDPGDAEPIGIGTVGLDVQIQRIKVLRDLYYTSFKGSSNSSDLENEIGESVRTIERLHHNPELWSDEEAIAVFRKKKGQTEPMFELVDSDDDAKDQFLPMGDNSPKSLDGRVWPGPHFVDRELLIGRAMLIYWPHTLNKPIKYFPNFGRMGFIR